MPDFHALAWLCHQGCGRACCSRAAFVSTAYDGLDAASAQLSEGADIPVPHNRHIGEPSCGIFPAGYFGSKTFIFVILIFL